MSNTHIIQQFASVAGQSDIDRVIASKEMVEAAKSAFHQGMAGLIRSFLQQVGGMNENDMAEFVKNYLISNESPVAAAITTALAQQQTSQVSQTTETRTHTNSNGVELFESTSGRKFPWIQDRTVMATASDLNGIVVPPVIRERAIAALSSRDGLELGEVISAVGLDVQSNTDKQLVRACLRSLARDGKIQGTEGMRRGKRYRLVVQS